MFLGSIKHFFVRNKAKCLKACGLNSQNSLYWPLVFFLKSPSSLSFLEITKFYKKKQNSLISNVLRKFNPSILLKALEAIAEMLNIA